MAFNKNPLKAQDELIPYSVDLEDRVEEGFDDMGEMLDKMFPIGTIYESTSSTNPGTFRPGTWELYGQGRVTVGLDTTQTEFNTIDKTGGAKTHKLTISEMPRHDHALNRVNTSGDGTRNAAQWSWTNSARTTSFMSVEGNDKPHNNLQPYIAVIVTGKQIGRAHV